MLRNFPAVVPIAQTRPNLINGQAAPHSEGGSPTTLQRVVMLALAAISAHGKLPRLSVPFILLGIAAASQRIGDSTLSCFRTRSLSPE